jgi:hypothetical protein
MAANRLQTPPPLAKMPRVQWQLLRCFTRPPARGRLLARAKRRLLLLLLLLLGPQGLHTALQWGQPRPKWRAQRMSRLEVATRCSSRVTEG